MPSQLGMGPSYYKVKTENVKVSLIISNLVSKILLSLMSRMAQFSSVSYIVTENLSPVMLKGKILKFTRISIQNFSTMSG